ncbi:MAG TPA: SCO family protein, partial [Chromatiaceae bacterium]|nr:SCO family protein [Chromatiaceae bacterium]
MEYNTRQIKNCIQPDDASVFLDRAAGKSADPGVGGRFMLVDHNGKLVSREDMLGKYQLIYFGYTYCPDVCPTSLQVMAAALKNLDPGVREKIQPWFITVDPERDSQEVLAGYVTYFDKEMIGLTGSRAMIDQLLKE